jgi:O-antigen/teichoic acid export membrane protein
MVLLVSGSILPLLCLIAIQRRIQQGLHHIIASIVPDDLLIPLLTASGVLLFSRSHGFSVLTVYSGAIVVVTVISSLWLYYCIPSGVRRVQSQYDTRAWWGMSLPMLLASSSQLVMNKSDTLMLSWLSTMSAVGMYGAASRLANLSTFVMMAVAVLATPLMATAYHKGDYGRFHRVLNRAMLAGALGALPALLLLLALPAQVLALFGGGFVEGAKVLRILAVGQFVNAVTGPVSFALLMSGREKPFAASLAIMAAATICGDALLIPRYGATGVAAVTAACVAIVNIWQLVLTRRIGRELVDSKEVPEFRTPSAEIQRPVP